MARLFSGTSHWIDCSAGAIGHSGGITLAAVFTATVTSSRTVMSITRPSLSGGYAELRLTTLTLNANCSIAGTVSPSSNIAVPSDTWVLGAWTKASGTATLRFHLYDYSTGSWTRGNSSSTRDDPAEAASGVTLGGITAHSQSLGGNLAVAGQWARNLSDAELDRLPYSLQAWHATGPAALWLLDQAATTTAVRDLTGGGANQSAINSTAVSTLSVPILSYGHPIIVRSREAGGAATVTGTVTANLGGLTATAAGTRTVHGTVAASLGPLTASAAGQRTVHGTAAASLGGLTATAQGVRTVGGQITASLGGLSAAAVGQRTVHGVATVALGGLTATAVADVAAVRASSTPSVTARRTSTAAVSARRTSIAAVGARRTSTSTVEG